MKFIKTLVLAALTILSASDLASARPGRGGAAPATSHPVLANSSDNFGSRTQLAHGGARLSSMDVTTTAAIPVTQSGINLQTAVGTTCATWTVTQIGGTAGHWTIIAANTTEGTTAITPVPSSAGVTAQLNGGPYTFTVQCKDAGGNASNTVTLTRTIISNAVNIGDQDRNDSGMFPSGFGNTPGALILFSTGFNKSNVRFDFKQGANFANQVVLEDADVTKHSALTNMAVSSFSNLKVYGLYFSGSQAAAVAATATCTLCGSAGSGNHYTNLTFDNDFALFSEATMAFTPGSSWGAFGGFANCDSGCGISNSGADYNESGFSLGTGSTGYITNVFVGHSFNNCYFIGNSGTASAGWTITDSGCYGPMTHNSEHPDVGQVADQGTPFNTTFKHFWQIESDGDDNSQGLPFGGGPLGVGNNVLGYISAGAGNASPGKVLTLTSGVFGFAANSSRIFSPAGSPVGLADQVVMTCSVSCTGKTSATLALGADTNVGSAASPVNFYSISSLNFNVNGVVYDGGTFRGASWAGENGTSSYTNFALVDHGANPFYATSFTGQIVGNVLTITGPITNSIPTTVPPYWIGGYFAGSGGRLSYSGCNYCGVGINIQLTGTSGDVGTYQLTSAPGNIGPIPMSVSFSYPVAGAGAVYFNNCTTTNLHGGTLTVESGYAAAYNNSPACPNATLTNNLLYSNLVAADFASGQLPVAYLSAITAAQWASYDWPTKQLKECLALKPASTGHLVLGGGAFVGPFTGATAVDGSGGGDWISSTSNTSDGTHIPGCEAIP